MRSFLFFLALLFLSETKGQNLIDTLYNIQAGYKRITHAYSINKDTLITVFSAGNRYATDSNYFNHVIFLKICTKDGNIKELHRIQKNYWDIGVIPNSPIEIDSNSFAYILIDTANREWGKYRKQKYLVAKTADNWQTFTTHEIGIPFNQYFISACVKTDNGYLVMCDTSIYTNSPACIAMLDLDFNLKWKKILSSPNQFRIKSVLPATDGYILSGYKFVTPNFAEVTQLYQAKIDTAGNFIWQKDYTDTSKYYYGYVRRQGIKLNDKYYNFGTTGQNGYDNGYYRKGYLNAIDENGNLLLEKIYKHGENFLFSKIIKENNYLYAVAYMDSLNPVTNEIINYVHFSKISPETGKMEWCQLYKHWNTYNEMSNLYAATDGFLLCGSAVNPNRFNEFNTTGIIESDAWLLKVDTNGCIVPGCKPNIYGGVQHILNDNSVIEVYPNPAKYFFTINLKNTELFKSSNEVFIFDATGKELFHKTIKSNQGKLIIENAFNYSGFAFLVIKNANGTFYKKIVLQ